MPLYLEWNLVPKDGLFTSPLSTSQLLPLSKGSGDR